MTLRGIDFNNGLYGVIEEKPVRVKTAREVQDEDWKTALVHKQEPIPAEEHLDAEIVNNCYGTFLKVRYKAWWYYIKPTDCDYIGV